MGVKNNLINMIYLSIIIGLIGTQCPANAQLTDIFTLAGFALASYQTLDGIHDTYLKFETASTDDIIEKVAGLSATVDKWGYKMENKLEEIHTFLRRLPLLEGIASDVRVLTKYFSRISGLYSEFKEYLEDPGSFNNDTVAFLTETFISREGNDVVATVNDLHSLIVPDLLENYKKSVLLLLAQETQEFALEVCDLGVPQYRIIDFYSIVATIELRALTMTSTGYLMRSLQRNLSYMGEIKRTNNRFIARAESYLLLLRNAMEISSKQFRRCDPSEGYIRDESFYEFERFLQAVVVAERELVSGHYCSGTCENVPQPTYMHPCDAEGCESAKPECHGSLRNCKTLNEKAQTCEMEETEPRRFQWIRDGWGKLHPDGSSSCDNEIRYYAEWLDQLLSSCDVCRCLCAEEDVSATSAHFINLREQLSDVANNMVIVGLQFVIIDKIAHLEILQGLLGSNGTIDENGIEWIDLEDIQYNYVESIKSGSFKFYKKNEDGSQEEMIKDKDIAVLNYDLRRINLDKLTAPKKQLVTGIKFAREKAGSSTKSLHLEIQATPFDYDSGQLDIEKSVWIGPEDADYVKGAEIRTQYVETDFRNPELSRSTTINTKPNTYLDIQPSGWDEDASQTVIPFLDALPVYSEPLIPLTGVGLYHKKQQGYGGFLTLVLEGFDRSPYVVDRLLVRKPKEDKSGGNGRRRS